MKLLFCVLNYSVFTVFYIRFGNASKDLALVVMKNGLEYKFANPFLLAADNQFVGYSQNWNKNKRLYYLCPKKSEGPLHSKEKVADEIGKPKEICKHRIVPKLFKVLGKLCNRHEQERFECYHNGFEIEVGKKARRKLNPIYESMNKGNYLLPMIYVYRHISLEYTVAVKYEIIQAENKIKPYYTSVENYLHHQPFSDKLHTLYENQKTKLKEIFGQDYNDDTIPELVERSLVNENNFIVETWKRTSYFKEHLVLIWKKCLSNWENVEEFVRTIARTSSKSKVITVGPGRGLTIRDDKVGRSYQMKWENENILIPELYWHGIEYAYQGKMAKGDSTPITLGLFVIMHNDPITEPRLLRKVCEEDYCTKKKIWRLSNHYDETKGMVYCCEMNETSIQKLGVEFLHKPLPPMKQVTAFTFPRFVNINGQEKIII